MMPKLQPVTRENIIIGYAFYCPGCGGNHMIRTDRTGEENPDLPIWEFDGDLEKPTFKPSLLCRTPNYGEKGYTKRCHLFVRDGKIQYLNDCSHALAGTTVDIPSQP